MVICHNFKFLALTSLVFIASQGFGQKRMIPHLTSPTGGFTSKMLLANLTEANQTYRLLGFNTEGSQVAVAEGALAPFQTLTHDPATLFSQPISHVEVAQGEGVRLSVEYQRDRPGTGPAQVHESTQQATRWRIFPGNNAVTWDGLAAVNTGESDIDIMVRQLDAAGTLIGGPRTIIQNLSGNGKVLYLFGSDFETHESSFFEIEATGPLALLALRGNLASDFLWENGAVAIANLNREGTRIGTHVTSPSGGFISQVIIANPTGEDKAIQLDAFDATGSQVRVVNRIVPAGETLFEDAATLLGETTSHFEITGDGDIAVSMSYQRDRENTGPAQVLEAHQISATWRVYPGNQAVTWDGLAMVNRGNLATDILVSQIDENGSLIRGPIMVAEQLGPNAKALYLLATDFQSEPGAFFEITAGKPLAMMAIRGNQGSDFIWENTAVLLPELGPAATPPARIDYAFAFDPQKRVGIMMGGFDENFALLTDTWLWNGRRWRQVTTPDSPLPRSYHAGTFNAQTGQMIIFGGFRTRTQKRNDFMAFDGENWQPYTGHPDIPAEDGELVFDPNRNVLVLVVTKGNSLQTWEFFNGAWTRKITETGPGKRLDQGFVYDRQNQRIIMFGGMNAAREIVNGTWVFEAGNWRQLNPSHAPEPRWVTYAVYDPKRDMATIFAGEGNGPNGLVMYRDTWEFDGTNWHKR